ncbi:hypothetical protein LINPERPRIM_LOCUS39784 [Linum perenne]
MNNINQQLILLVPTGTSNKFETIQRRFAWSLCKNDMHKSRNCQKKFLKETTQIIGMQQYTCKMTERF